MNNFDNRKFEIKNLILSKSNSEKYIYLVFWTLIFLIPILLSPAKGHLVDWLRVTREILYILPFFILFSINNLLLFKFILKKKYINYFISTFLILLLISLLSSSTILILKYFQIPISRDNHGPKIDLLWFLNTYFYNFLISILVIGFNNAIKLTFSWYNEIQKTTELETENYKNQLLLLRHQISPHFFMNTLNNIHALIDYDQNIAKNSVVQLSKLMRVMLYETETENYSIQSEINFLNDYIELMKIRISNNVDIQFNYQVSNFNSLIPTLLFINFLENSFKHGIKAIGKSFIHISMKTENEHLLFNIKNSRSSFEKQKIESGNLGLLNIQKRLDLIYSNRYSLEYISEIDTFEVNLKIPLNEN